MINYFITDTTGRILGLGTTVDISLITPPQGQSLNVGVVPYGANTYINGVFSTEPEPEYVIEQEALVKRFNMLCASDWTQLPDVPVYNRPDWIEYRQKLRDLPDQIGWPTSIIWPQPPA